MSQSKFRWPDTGKMTPAEVKEVYWQWRVSIWEDQPEWNSMRHEPMSLCELCHAPHPRLGWISDGSKADPKMDFHTWCMNFCYACGREFTDEEKRQIEEAM